MKSRNLRILAGTSALLGVTAVAILVSLGPTSETQRDGGPEFPRKIQEAHEPLDAIGSPIPTSSFRESTPKPSLVAAQGDLEVYVSDQEGRPARLAQVQVFSTGGDETCLAHGVTHADGRAVFSDLPSQTKLRVALDPGESKDTELKSDSVTIVRLKTLPTRWVQVFVEDEDQQPVREAQVLSHRGFKNARAIELGKTDSNGSLEIPLVLTDTIALTAWARDHRPARVREWRIREDTPTSIRLCCPRGGASVSGRVTAAGNGVVAHVEIGRFARGGRLHDDGFCEYPPRPRTGRTNKDGTFEVQGLPPGRHPVLVSSSDVRYGWWTGNVDVASDEATHLDITLGAPSMVRGKVTLFGGEGAAHARITLRDAAGLITAREFKADATGEFRIEALGSGTLTFAASHFDGEAASKVITLTPGITERWDVRLGLARTLRGHVTDDSGNPRPRLSVLARATDATVWMKTAVTDAAGHFSITGCPDADMALSFFEPENPGAVVKQQFGIRAEPHDQKFVIPEGVRASATISVIVKDDRGQPLNGARVDVVATGLFGRQTLITNSEGRAISSKLSPGSYRVTVQMEGRGQIEAGVQRLVADEQKDLGVVYLALAGRLEVSLDPPAPSDSSAYLWIFEVGKPQRPLHTSPLADRPNISFEIKPGRFVAYVGGDKNLAQSKNFEVVSGEVTKLTLEFLRRGTFQVKAFWNGTEQPEELRVVCRALEGGAFVEIRLERASQGTYIGSIELVGGSYRFEVAPGSPDSFTQEIHLGRQPRPQLEIVLSPWNGK